MSSASGNNGAADDIARYQAVVARRLQYDNQMWQVPVLSLTAQAFLFTIALGAGSTRFARCIASVLAVVTACASMILMAGHRRSEFVDAAWLADYEEQHFGPTAIMHGPTYKRKRDEALIEPPMRLFAFFDRTGTFKYWMGCLLVFGLAALVVFILAIFHPRTLS